MERGGGPCLGRRVGAHAACLRAQDASRVGRELGFLPAEGTPEQIDEFPFQRLMLITERYKEP
jgi:hypothetical protein